MELAGRCVGVDHGKGVRRWPAGSGSDRSTYLRAGAQPCLDAGVTVGYSAKYVLNGVPPNNTITAFVWFYMFPELVLGNRYVCRARVTVSQLLWS